MNALVETVRGLTACTNWILGAPFVNARVTYAAKDKWDGRAIFARHCQRFLDTCRIETELDGPTPVVGKGCVLCYNESSFADLMAYMVAISKYVDRAAAADLYKYFPFARSAFTRVDIEMVQRRNRAATDALISSVVERIRSGERVAWGGEGRLSGIDGIGRFKVGASLIAIRAQAPVIPVVFHGGHHTMPLGAVRARPGTIRIRFGEPISTAGLHEDDARPFADRLQSRLSEMYEEAGKTTELQSGA